MKIKFDLCCNGNLTLAEAVLGSDKKGKSSVVKSIVKGIMNLADKIKDDNSVKVLDMFKGRFATMLNKKLHEHGIYVSITDVEFKKTAGNGLCATVTADKINYVEIAESILSMMPEWLPQNREGLLIEEIANVLDEEKSVLVMLLLKLINDSKKEKIIAICVDAYNAEICRELTELFKENNMALSVEKVAIIA